MFTFAPHPLFKPHGYHKRPRSRAPVVHANSSAPEHASPPNLHIIPRRPNYIPSPRQTEPVQIAILAISHRSPCAATHVTQTINQLKPQAVLLELCKFRTGMLKTPSNFPGGEVRTGYEAAKRIGAEVVLADLPITKTLSRAWNALTFRDRLLFLFGILLSSFLPVPDPALVKAVVTGNGDDVIDRYIALLTSRFPRLKDALITKRDKYLAWSVRHSQAVSGKHTVLAIIGAAHVPGVLSQLQEDDRLRSNGEAPRLTFKQVAS